MTLRRHRRYLRPQQRSPVRPCRRQHPGRCLPRPSLLPPSCLWSTHLAPCRKPQPPRPGPACRESSHWPRLPLRRPLRAPGRQRRACSRRQSHRLAPGMSMRRATRHAPFRPLPHIPRQRICRRTLSISDFVCAARGLGHVRDSAGSLAQRRQFSDSNLYV